MDFYRTAPFPNQAVTSHDQPDAGTIHKSHIPKIQYQRVWTNSLQHSVNFFPQAARPMMVNLSNQVGSYPLFFGLLLSFLPIQGFVFKQKKALIPVHLPE